MTVEELLMPRYKVIADYPHNPYKIGDLLEEFTKTAFKLTVTYNGNSMDETQANTYPASAIEKMTHLFRKLNWWEERKVEDMPEYLRYKNFEKVPYPPFKEDEVLNVLKWLDDGTGEGRQYFVTDEIDDLGYYPNGFLPATEQEYNDYINSTPCKTLK